MRLSASQSKTSTVGFSLLSACLLLQASCSSSNSDNPALDDDQVPGSTISVISVDKHVDLLKYVFDIFTGRNYGPTMLKLPNYPNSAYEDHTVSAASVIESQACINGGTATFTPFFLSEYYSGGDRDGWNFNFDNCQQDTTVFDGMVIRESIDAGAWLSVTSTQLEVNSQSLVTRFSGELDYKPGAVRGGGQFFHYTVNGVSFSATENSEPFELVDASFNFSINGFWYKSLSGQFSIKSVETGEQRLNVLIVEPLSFGRAVNPIIVSGQESDN